MYVIGATKAESLKEVREIIPNSFLLVPGIGAQEEVYQMSVVLV